MRPGRIWDVVKYRRERDNGDIPVRRLIQLAESFAIGEIDEWKNNVEKVENWIFNFLHRLDFQMQRAGWKANEKAKYYRLFLYEQLNACDRLKRDLDCLGQPTVGISIPRKGQ